MDKLDDIPAARKAFQENGWAPIKRVMDIDVADATLYMIQRELGGDWESYQGDYIKTFLTDQKSFECYSFDYSPLSTLQWGLTPYLSTITGKHLAPSHGYFRVYREADVCHLHSDTFACEYAMSLTLGYSDDFIWNFDISKKSYDADIDRPVNAAVAEGGVELINVPLSIGDGVLYNGINHLHGRISPNPNRWAAQVFFHWVDRQGKYAEHAFDGRYREFVQRANFEFPKEDRPEKINPNRADLVKTRGR